MARKRSTKPPKGSSIPRVRVRDNDHRSYVGGAYLTGLIAKLAITPLGRWNDKVINKGAANLVMLYVGFRCYRPYRKDLTE